MQRNTRQRGAIKRVLQRSDRPLTPEEVLAHAQREVSGLGIATVYRNVGKLVEEGWLATVQLPNEPARYELASLPHHHHFRCSSCGQVFDVGCPVSESDVTVPEGFRVTAHEVVLHGTCPDCGG